MHKQKIIVTTSAFDRQMKKLTKKGLYTEELFLRDMRVYTAHEDDKKRRKHKIDLGNNQTIRSVTLDDDLRTLYFHMHENATSVEYVFFKIGDHDSVY